MKKFLIIRLSSIGDIVLTTPVIRCLKKQTPQCQIHYLTKKQFYPVVAANPYIDKIFTLQDSINEVIPQLKAEEYDCIIDLHKNFRSRGVRMKLKKPGFSFNKINARKWLLVNLKINRLPNLHIVDRYFVAVEKLGIKNDNEGLDYFIPDGEEVSREDLPAEHQKTYIGWVIGGKHNTKIFPEEKVAETCKQIQMPVILIGGPEDAAKGDRIVLKAGPHIYNACGKFSVNQSASLVQKADLILTNDTGMMHVAAAFGKRIISFWGNTIPEFGMYPYLPGTEYKSVQLEVKDLSCRPCSKIGYKSCPKNHFHCMNKIDVKEVVRRITED